MKKLVFLFVCLCLRLSGQTYFNSASNPADNAALGASVVSVTPPGSMAVGDLVILVGQVKTTNSDIVMSDQGGQNWQRVDVTIGTSNLSVRVYWCRFNGTWPTNPSMSFLSTTATTVVMHVFRPSATNKTWGIGQASITGSYAAPASPFNVVRTGVTIAKDQSISLAIFASVDDNTWLESAGAFTEAGLAQYRNINGTQMSMAFGYYYSVGAGGGTGDATWQQATLGGDAGSTAIITWYEYTPTKVGVPWAIFNY